MYSIEIDPGVSQQTFLYYLKVNEIDINVHELTNFSINIENDNSGVLYPGLGEFYWTHKGERFLITFREEGEPVCAGSIQYFKRLIVRHEDLRVLKEFVHEALTYIRPTDSGKIQIMSSKSKGYWDDHSSIYCQKLDSIYINPDVKKSIIFNIDHFLASKERYNRFGRSYKLCYLLAGVPGSGKTSLVKAIAEKYKRPIYVLNFTKSLTDEILIELIGCVKDNCIILVEDIDAYFVDRKPQDINVSFSIIINILDGTLVMGNGTIIIMTANNPDIMDPALIRPGRVDHIVKFGNPCKNEIHSAFTDITEITDDVKFNEFYKSIKSKGVSMSGIVDFLFRHPTDYMEKIEELLAQTSLYHAIVNDKTDKLYS